MALVSLAEVKDYLEIKSTEQDGRLTNLISYASSVINTYCNRTIEANTYTEYHDGGYTSIFLDNIPLNNVTLVAEYDGSDYINLAGPDANGVLPSGLDANANSIQYMWYEGTGEVRRLVNDQAVYYLDLGKVPMFNNYPKGVKIVYGGGYINIPNDLKLAALDYIKMLHKNEQGSDSFSFAGESKNTHNLSSNFPPHIRRILEMYRIIL